MIEKAVERSLDAYIAATTNSEAATLLMTKPETEPSRLLKIGALAEAANETIHTIRFWTKEGLLEVASHSPGGYQLYDSSMIDQARKIRQLQRAKRLTLPEIKAELKRAA